MNKHDKARKARASTFPYKDIDFYNDLEIGSCIDNFPFCKHNYRDHVQKYMCVHYFDDFILAELRLFAKHTHSV